MPWSRLFLLIIAVFLYSASPIWAASPIWLEGRVLEQGLSPLAGATVSTGNFSEKTLDDGSFVLGPLYGDFVRLTVTADGYKQDITDLPLGNVKGSFDVVLIREQYGISQTESILQTVPTRARTARQPRPSRRPGNPDAAICSLPPAPSIDGPSGLLNIPTAQGLKNQQNIVGVHIQRRTNDGLNEDTSYYKAIAGVSDQMEIGAAFLERKPDGVGTSRSSQAALHLKYTGRTSIENVTYCMGAQARTNSSNVFLGATYDAHEALGSLVIEDDPDVRQPTFNLGVEVPLDPHLKSPGVRGHSVIVEMEEEPSTSKLDQYTFGWRYRNISGGNVDFYHTRNYMDDNDYTTGIGGSITF